MTNKEKLLDNICNNYCKYPYIAKDTTKNLCVAADQLKMFCKECKLAQDIGNLDYED